MWNWNVGVSVVWRQLNTACTCIDCLSAQLLFGLWNFPHLVVVVCVSWGRRFALWRRCRPDSRCRALYFYWGFFSSCWWMVGLYAAPVPVSSAGSNRWQSRLPCLKNRAVELLTHKAQTTTTNRPICLSYCPIFATVCLLLPFDRNGWWSKISTHDEREYTTPN